MDGHPAPRSRNLRVVRHNIIFLAPQQQGSVEGDGNSSPSTERPRLLRLRLHPGRSTSSAPGPTYPDDRGVAVLHRRPHSKPRLPDILVSEVVERNWSLGEAHRPQRDNLPNPQMEAKPHVDNMPGDR